MQVAWPDGGQFFGECLVTVGLAQNVIDAGTQIAGVGQRRADVDLAAAGLVSADPASAVNDHDGGHALIRGVAGREVEIQLFHTAPAKEGNVVFDADFVVGVDVGDGEQEQKRCGG